MKPFTLLFILITTQIQGATASWYGQECAGSYTANGELFNPNLHTCASWYYPFDTILKVTNIHNGKSVLVRVNDRGPAKRLNREIDLSEASFAKIADKRLGLISVTIKPIITPL